MPIVLVGNTAAIDHRTRTVIPGEQVTTFEIDSSVPVDNAVTSIVHQDGAWRAHSISHAPAWVESDSPEILAALAAHWGCPVGRPNAEAAAAQAALTVEDPSVPVVVVAAA